MQQRRRRRADPDDRLPHGRGRRRQPLSGENGSAIAVEMALTRRQQLFAHEYLIDLNATQAAIRAGYSARTAHVQGHRMITNANISEFIDNAIAERLERLGVTADRVIAEWATIGFASMGDFVTADEYGCPTWDFENTTRVQSAAIRDISIHTGSRGRRIAIKLADKPSALLILGKYLERAMAASRPEALPPPSSSADDKASRLARNGSSRRMGRPRPDRAGPQPIEAEPDRC